MQKDESLTLFGAEPKAVKVKKTSEKQSQQTGDGLGGMYEGQFIVTEGGYENLKEMIDDIKEQVKYLEWKVKKFREEYDIEALPEKERLKTIRYLKECNEHREEDIAKYKAIDAEQRKKEYKRLCKEFGIVADSSGIKIIEENEKQEIVQEASF